MWYGDGDSSRVDTHTHRHHFLDACILSMLVWTLRLVLLQATTLKWLAAWRRAHRAVQARGGRTAFWAGASSAMTDVDRQPGRWWAFSVILALRKQVGAFLPNAGLRVCTFCCTMFDGSKPCFHLIHGIHSRRAAFSDATHTAWY